MIVFFDLTLKAQTNPHQSMKREMTGVPRFLENNAQIKMYWEHFFSFNNSTLTWQKAKLWSICTKSRCWCIPTNLFLSCCILNRLRVRVCVGCCELKKDLIHWPSVTLLLLFSFTVWYLRAPFPALGSRKSFCCQGSTSSSLANPHLTKHCR